MSDFTFPLKLCFDAWWSQITKKYSKKDCVELAMKGSGNFWMDSDISDYEVKATFGRGTDTHIG